MAVDVRSASEGVATAHLEGTGLSTVVIVTPVGQGSTTVVVSSEHVRGFGGADDPGESGTRGIGAAAGGGRATVAHACRGRGEG